ncbi:hypothetical protein [Priestia koreensis]|uniref:hypothetical protein n=1 Tax=Priestia koreensis TaxID=284581 RepID=UPI00203C5EB5|nr:hypothetical protein [Priestia koreensis]MCM3005426.1 hypothetical protein [Priestia koreensis]
MRRVLLIVGLVAILVGLVAILVGLCVHQFEGVAVLHEEKLETKTLSQFYPKGFDHVSKIAILNGSSGAKKTTTDKQSIVPFINSIKDIPFIPDENQERRVGFRYNVTFYNDKKSIFSFSMTNVDGHYYHTEPDLYPIVDTFYKQLNVEEIAP